MISPASKMFSAPPQEVTFSGLLFDMDGTIIDSTEAVVKHWHMFVLQLYSLLFQGHSFKIPACFFYFVMLEGGFLSSYSYKFKWLTAVFSKSIGNEIGVDPNVILQTSHGRRSIDILKDIDPSKANWECKIFQPYLYHPTNINQFMIQIFGVHDTVKLSNRRR